MTGLCWFIQADSEAALLGKALLAAAEPSFRAATAVGAPQRAAQWHVFPAEQVLCSGARQHECHAYMDRPSSNWAWSQPQPGCVFPLLVSLHVCAISSRLAWGLCSWAWAWKLS